MRSRLKCGFMIGVRYHKEALLRTARHLEHDSSVLCRANFVFLPGDEQNWTCPKLRDWHQRIRLLSTQPDTCAKVIYWLHGPLYTVKTRQTKPEAFPKRPFRIL